MNPTTLRKKTIMKQYAIIFTKNNASAIAETLIEYTAEELLEEYDWMFANTNSGLVLAKDVLDSGVAVLSYVVVGQMFETNNPGIQLNDQTFTDTQKF